MIFMMLMGIRTAVGKFANVPSRDLHAGDFDQKWDGDFLSKEERYAIGRKLDLTADQPSPPLELPPAPAAPERVRRSGSFELLN